tara:strand:+ start:13743 stop:14471 length:729 start_codon:yes stop_codon:yes gene_type:complete
VSDTYSSSSIRFGTGLTALGILGAVVTAFLGVYYAPMVNPVAFNAPEAYRILYWHVPFAWSSFLAFCMLFTGAVAWYKDRSDWGWRWFSTGSDLGLLFGLGVITSGPIWGSAEWGVPWDWGDLRLNTFALLTGVAFFLVLSRRSQPDGQDTRDTLAAIGLFGFALVPITALATTWYQKRHPGIVIIDGEGTGLDPAIRAVLMFGFFSFLVLFVGLAILSDSVIKMEEMLEEGKRDLDEVNVK